MHSIFGGRRVQRFSGRRITVTAPSNLTATPTYPLTNHLSWQDNSSNETSFRIERGTDGVIFVEITSVGPGVISYDDSGLSASTTYYYRVRARSGAVNSSYSNTATGVMPALPSAAPSSLSSSLDAITTVPLNWTDNSSNETSFRIERDSGSGFTEIGSVGAGITTYTDYGTPWNVNCIYRVRARNAAGNSAYSNTSETLTSGFDGDLNLDGEENHLPSGTIKDYSSVSIINGSTLIFDSIGQMAWSIILCAGNFTQDNAASDSSIRVDGYEGSATGSTVTTTAPDGTVLSYLQNQSYGGDAYIGVGAFGNGGGGSASGQGGNGAELSGGIGGAGLNGAAGGNGSTNASTHGSDGDFDDETLGESQAWGGGGGGGFRGLNGGCLYIKVAGTMNATWGGGPPPISAIGTDGTNGGNGGGSICLVPSSAAGGNGGGGGGGGAGGKIVFRWKGVGSDPTLLLSVAVGNGGNAGAGGIATCPGSPSDGLDGFGGTNGESGVIDLATY